MSVAINWANKMQIGQVWHYGQFLQILQNLTDF